jgi:hypothetical protein|tara:strand:+ start:1167 stop:1295 length:129 start_codon:yes stop_codon:yes gene_type:complete
LDELVQLRENLKLTKEIEVLTDKKIEVQTVDQTALNDKITLK